MLNRITFRRVSQLALTLLAIVALAATLAGCSASSSTGGTGSASTGSSSSATASSTVGQQQTLPFDHAASLVGRPRRAAESTLNVAWFPPDPTLLTGLRQLTDKKKIAELTKVASGNAQFWVELPNNHVKPIVFGSDFPHGEGLPEPELYLGQLKNLGDDDTRLVMRDNLARFLDLV